MADPYPAKLASPQKPGRDFPRPGFCGLAAGPAGPAHQKENAGLGARRSLKRRKGFFEKLVLYIASNFGAICGVWEDLSISILFNL